MEFEDKVVVVTGGGAGIGLATAEAFAAEGAKVVIADYDAAAARKAEKYLTAKGSRALAVAVDVSDPGQVKQMVEETLRAFGGIDVLFNNAGILFGGSIINTSFEDWNRLMAINLGGVFLCSKFALPHMISRGSGSIINVSSSTGAHDAKQDLAAYVASKGGVAMLTKAMALDHIKDNVRVNAICPGPTETPMLRGFFETEDQMHAFGEQFPMGRLGLPVEIAQVVLFLASSKASYVTGAVIAVDGGQTASI
jgi:NAD(P)-dependent dehydrogenase (short-subunit alcohol dehydrogenase family)